VTGVTFVTTFGRLEQTMKILVGIDGGPQQASALALGARLAKGGDLLVATVYPAGRATAGLGEAYQKAAEDAGAKVLEAAGEQLGSVRFEARAIAGLSAPRTLHRLAEEEHADLIVIGACHRGSAGRTLLGGTGERVVHGSPVPVVTAPRDYRGDPSEWRHVGVAFDGGPESDAALAWAERLARDTGAELELLTVVETVPVAVYPGIATAPSEALMNELRDDAQRRLDDGLARVSVPAVGRLIEEGATTYSLVQATKDLDLMVAGSRGYGPVGALLMGSVSRSLIHESACPVVVVPRTAASDDSAGADADALTAAE
jgi:nucleotide-binding universal stress UspA family protein